MNLTTFLVSAIGIGMTFLFGSTGETLTEKSGHLNLGIPGVMCVGASCGYFVECVYISSVGKDINPILAVLLPVLATLVGGALMGLIYAFLTVSLKTNQNVTGLALTTFGVGVANFMISKTDVLFENPSPVYASAGSIYFKSLFPFAKDLGWFGDIFLSHGILVYLAIVIALASSFILSKTRIGLNLRAVGENPATADAAGINVSLYRYLSTSIGCAIAGLGGLSYIMDYLSGNWEYDIDKLGWLAIALVIFTIWKPNWGILGSILFGALYIASAYITGISLATKELFKMLPFVVTLVVLIITSMRKKRENQPPESLGLPYFREER